ncbi:MAG TPA: molybdopterin-synthase adenylyltransferase MoeB [Gammaproteobacteria bacterium]|nr:molybdopterin-synthase adenylyltransferase MoeB [Gammaproteobacteria bacterium]
MLTDDELLRYSRQIMLPEVDIAGQEKLREATVLVVGLGGLGSPVVMYLAAAGVGKLVLVDHDQVDLSNLQRQIIHTTDRIGCDKVRSAQIAIAQLNPECQVQTITAQLGHENGETLVGDCQVIVDCSDNFQVRFLLNRLSVKHQLPLVSGAAIRMEGQVSVYDPKQPDSPCYRCLYQETGAEDQRCTSNGVLAHVVGVIGALQATETVKLIAGIGDSLVGRLVLVDFLTMEFRSIRLKQDATCPVCG